MPGNYLVTGSRGGNIPHVSSSEARNYNAGVVGPGNYVMSGLDASMTTANTLHVSDGVASFQGADVEVPNGGCDLTIQNGSQGMKRNDLVVFRYEVDGDVEGVSLEVIQGTPAASDPQDPAYNEGSISDGTSPVDFPLYRVPLDGITVGTPVKLFDTIPTIDSLRDSVSQNTDDIAALGATTNVRQDQTWDDIAVTAHERAGIVTVTVERWGKSGTALILATPSVAGHIKAGHRPSITRRQLLGAKTDGSWLYMEVDAAGAVKVGTLYAPGDSSEWGSFSGTLSYPVA